MTRIFRWLHLAGFLFLAVFASLTVWSFSKKNIYPGSLGVNLLMITPEGLGIVSVRPTRDLIELTRLPDNLMIDVGSGRGDYLVEAIYKVGLPVKNSLNTARISVGQNLGVVLSGVVKTNAPLSAAGLREALLSLSVRTNFGLIDRYRLVKEITRVLGKGSSLTAALPSSVFDSGEEPDGKKVLRLNPAIFVWSRNRWVNDEVLSETAELVVVNGSGEGGLGRTVARQIETAGGRVVDVIAAKKELSSRCLLFGDAKAHPQTVGFILSSFFCDRGKDLSVSDFVDTGTESDLVMVVGKNPD